MMGWFPVGGTKCQWVSEGGCGAIQGQMADGWLRPRIVGTVHVPSAFGLVCQATFR
jgi:hypothetical protein